MFLPLLLSLTLIAVAPDDAPEQPSDTAAESPSEPLPEPAPDVATAPEASPDDAPDSEASPDEVPDSESSPDDAPEEEVEILPPVPEEPPVPLAPPAVIAVSAGVEGDFADLTCGREPNEPIFTGIAARFASVPEALKIDSGDLFGTASPTRMLFSRMPDLVVAGIAASGLRVTTLGRDDLAAPRRAFLDFARALAKADITYVLSNLQCDPGAKTRHPPLCEVVRDVDEAPVIFDVGVERVAVLAAVSPDALNTVARDRREGLSLIAPAEALARQTARARELGATVVVALYEPERADPLKDTLQLAASLSGKGPDVMLVNRIASTLAAALPAEKQARIIATRRGTVIRHVLGTVEPEEVPRSELQPEVARLDRDATTLLCRELSRGYPGGVVSSPLDVEGFAAVLLDLLRTRADAEVAIINRGAIGSALFPVRRYLTPLHVNSALPFENRAVRTTMTGAELKAWATAPSSNLFYARGLSVTGGEVKVNGRPINDVLSYEVVTTDFVAEGGHGGLGEKLTFEPVGERTLRELLADFLETPRSEDPRKVLPDPAESTRWVFRYSLDGAFTSTNIYNPETRFSDPQLARVPAVTLRVDTEGRADADSPSYTLENGLRLRYATVSTAAPDAPPTGFVENLDVITGRSTLTLRYLRPEKARWYHPLPFVETYVESELSRPETRTYHHLELRPIAGGRLDLLEQLAVYVGAGASWEVLAKREQMVPPGSPAIPVLVAGWILRPHPLFTIAERVIEADSTLDFVYRDPFGTGGAQLRANVKFSVPIFRALSLTLGYDVFARYMPASSESQQTFGLSGDVLLGLKVTLWKSLQLR